MLFAAGMSQKAKYLEIRKELSPHFLMDEGLRLRNVGQESTPVEVLQQVKTKNIPIVLTYDANPYLYTADFYFGSNSQKAKLRFSTSTDWTIITSTECTKCPQKAYDKKASTSSAKGNISKSEYSVGGLTYAGETVKDRVCIGSGSNNCL